MLIIGDSITQDICFINAATHCFPGATVPDILDKLLEIMHSLPTSIKRIIVHVGTNDTTRRESERTKNDFKLLFDALKSCGKSVFISGPIPTVRRGADCFSRLLNPKNTSLKGKHLNKEIRPYVTQKRALGKFTTRKFCMCCRNCPTAYKQAKREGGRSFSPDRLRRW
uniref:SGNH hydrolase-type esterase domain-containing protein n=1 Tax=Cynoglossus semilaevis TaxID=244447 RepID=A0A3P8VXL9_CYNSE